MQATYDRRMGIAPEPPHTIVITLGPLPTRLLIVGLHLCMRSSEKFHQLPRDDL
jgi:hypothetical protein